MDIEGAVRTLYAPLLALLIAMATVTVTPVYGLEHLPEPDGDDLVQWQSLFDIDDDSISVAPGQEYVLTAPRLAILRVRFEEPHRASSTLRIDESTPAAPGSSTRALRRLQPFVLDDGDWLVVSRMSHRPQLRFYVDRRADEPVEFSVHQMTYAQPRYYWSWWQRALHDWYSDSGDTALPAGLAAPGRDDIVAATRRAEHLRRIVEEAGPDIDERRAAEHIGHALISRAVQSRRRPHFRYDTRHDLTGAVSSDARWVDVDPGERQSRAFVVEPDAPQSIALSGPGVLSLGVRTVKLAETANTITHYGLRVTESGFQVHSDEFSSGVARYDDDDTAAVADGDAPDDEASPEPALDAFDDAESRAGDDAPMAWLDDADQSLHYATDDTGTLLGWRRRTQMWVPPGDHRFVLHAENTPIRVDGHLVRPRHLIGQALERTGDTDWHIRRAEEHLSGLDSPIARLLRMEITDYLGDDRMARNQNMGFMEALSDGDVDDPLQQWSARRALDFDQLDTDGLQRLYRITTDADSPDWLRRDIGLELADYLLSGEAPDAALELLDGLPELGDDAAVDEGREQALRSRAIIEAAVDGRHRWTGISQLYRMWLRHPVDPDVTETLQNLWWYRTHWRSLEPGPTRRSLRRGVDPDEELESTPLLEPIAEPGSRVFVDDVADRRMVRFRLPDDRSVSLQTPRPVGDPNRATRLRLGALSNQVPTAYRAQLDDTEYWLVHDDEEYTEFDILTEPDNTFELNVETIGDDAELFSGLPPEGVEWLPARDVVAPRDYYRIDHRGASFDLDAPGTVRFVRVHLRGLEEEHDIDVIFDDGIDSPTRIDFEWRDDPQASSTFATSLVVPISPEADDFEVRSPHDDILVAVEQRSARPEEPAEPLHVDVELPLDDERQRQLRELSRSIADSDDAEMRLAERVERAELLMSLGSDRLAELDLERVTSDFRASGDTLERARRLLAALDERMDLWWLDVDPDFIDGQPTPLDPRAWLFSTADTNRADIAACLDDIEADRPTSEVAAGCRPAKRWLAAHSGDVPSPEQLLALLADIDDPSAPILDAVADGLQEAIRHTDSAGAGLASRSFMLARDALRKLPTPAIRATYYRALRWTSWQRISLWGSTSAMATINDDRPPSNAEAFTLPTIDDELDERIEFALLGVDWPNDEVAPLYSGSQRTYRFRPGDASVDDDGEGPAITTLRLQTTCLDLRPDLQPDGADNPCRLRAGLHDRHTGEAAATPQTPAFSPGDTHTLEWSVDADGDYRLELERLDELTGRRFIVYPTVGDGNDWAPLPNRIRRSLEIATTDQPVVFEAMGPAAVRLDARTLPTVGASSMDIDVVDDQGQSVSSESVDIDTSAQPGATLDMLDDQPLTVRTRHFIDLPDAMGYRVEVRPNRGQLGLRAVARVDDDEAIRAIGDDPMADRDDDHRELDAAPSSFGRESMQLELDDELLADLTSSPLALLDDDLLDASPTDITTRFELDWQNRNLDWDDGATVSSRDAAYGALRAGIYAAHPDEPLWGNISAGVRAKLQGSPIAETQAHGYWRTGWHDINIEPRLALYWQRFERNHYAIRSSLRASRSDRLAPRWLMINSGYLRLRLQEPLALFDSDGRVDPVMYNDYAISRRAGYEARSTMWHRPFLNVLLSGTGRVLWNPNATFDQTSLQLQARSVFHTTDLRASYRLRYLFDDAHRDRSQHIHELNARVDVFSWALGDHLLELGGWSRYSFAPQSRTDAHRIRMGIGISLWRNMGDFSNIPPSQRVFDHLIRPEYFSAP